MSDLNINCKHKQVIKSHKEKIDFCHKCGCFITIKYTDKVKEVESYSILHKKTITSLDISPYDTMANIKKSVKDANLAKDLKNMPEDYLDQRKYLIEMLKEYIVEYNFATRSYFLGIYIMDSIFVKHNYEEITSKLKPDMLVLGVFLAAVKFIDDDAYPPSLDTFTNKKNPAIFYSVSEVRKYEFMVIKLLEFKLDFFTSYYLTETILSHGVVFTYEIQKMGIKEAKAIKDIVKKLNKLALDINKIFIENIESMKFSALEIAATSILMAKELLQFEITWNNELKHLYGINSEDLSLCYNSILK